MHIKETFAARMADIHVPEQVAYLAFNEGEGPHVHLFECMCPGDQFNNDLKEKLDTAKKSSIIDKGKSRPLLRAYLIEKKAGIESILNFTIVTNFRSDPLLTLKDGHFMYVYFGAMTKLLISVACWLRIPMKDKVIDRTEENKPEIFFWVLHRSYAQDLEGLGEDGVEIDKFKKTLTFSESIEYPSRV